MQTSELQAAEIKSNNVVVLPAIQWRVNLMTKIVSGYCLTMEKNHNSLNFYHVSLTTLSQVLFRLAGHVFFSSFESLQCFFFFIQGFKTAAASLHLLVYLFARSGQASFWPLGKK